MRAVPHKTRWRNVDNYGGLVGRSGRQARESPRANAAAIKDGQTMRRPPSGVHPNIHPLRDSAQLQWLSLAVVASFVLLTGLNAGDSPAWTAFDNVGEAAAAVLATVACPIRVSRGRLAYSAVAEMESPGHAEPGDLRRQRQPRLA